MQPPGGLKGVQSIKTVGSPPWQRFAVHTATAHLSRFSKMESVSSTLCLLCSVQHCCGTDILLANSPIAVVCGS